MISKELIILKNSTEDLKWFQQNSDKIYHELEGQFIAIKDKKVVSFAPTFEILIKKLRERNIDPNKVLIKALSPRNETSIL